MEDSGEELEGELEEDLGEDPEEDLGECSREDPEEDPEEDLRECSEYGLIGWGSPAASERRLAQSLISDLNFSN